MSRRAAEADDCTLRVDVVLAGDGGVRIEDRDFLTRDDGYVAEQTEHAREEIADQDHHPLSGEAWQSLRSWTERAFDEPASCGLAWDPPAARRRRLP
jgi:hypothetical protein